MRFQRDRFSLEVGEAKGRPLPEWFLNQPAVNEISRFYLDSFFELSLERVTPERPIPGSRIDDFADKHVLQWDVARVFKGVVRQLDFAYLEWAKQQKPSQGD